MLALMLIACDKNGTEDMGGGCTATRTAIAVDEAAPNGLLGQDLLDAVGSAGWTGTFTYADGTTSPLTLGITPDTATLVFVDQEPEENDSGTDIAWECPDSLEMEAELALDTEDGVFAELLAGVLNLSEEGGATARAELDPYGLNGSFSIDPYIADIEDLDEVSLDFSGSFDGAAASGAIDGQATTLPDCEGDECSVSATLVEVGTWEAAPPAE